MSFLNILSFLATHPLGGRGAIGRFFRWQVASRLLPGPFIIPFVGGTSLVVERGMTDATGDYYRGLHEFEDMAFVLHALRSGDLFVDVGANIGSYSILAASTGASVIAFEPVPATFQRLERNIHFNRFFELIDARNEGVAAKPGSLPFTVGLDTINHDLRPRRERYSGRPSSGDPRRSACLPAAGGGQDRCRRPGDGSPGGR